MPSKNSSYIVVEFPFDSLSLSFGTPAFWAQEAVDYMSLSNLRELVKDREA